MSVTFTKLFSSITESTIWCEDAEVRVVWITMLAMADRMGRVWGSIPGLANRARVSIEKTEEALHKFLSPDGYSRTKEFEGRRIEIIDGGWRLLNHDKYRKLRDDDERREYKKHWIANKRSEVVDNVDKSRPQYTKAEAEAEADIKHIARKRAHQMPENFMIDNDMTAWAIGEGLTTSEVILEGKQFIDHHTAKGSSFKDWRAAWRTWVRNSKKWKRGNCNEENKRIDNSAPARVRRANAKHFGRVIDPAD